MSAYLAERVKENDIVVCSPPWSLDCMKYYQARLSKPLPLWNWDALITATPEQLEQLRAQDGSVWYLAKGYLPKKERLEGQQFPAYCVYRYDNVTTKTADFRGVAEELAGGAGSSDLVVKQMAVALQGKGEHQKVIELLEDHLRKPIAHTYMDMWGILARSYADTGQLDKAVEAYKTCAASQTGDERAWAWYRAVCVYFNDKQYDAALEEGLGLAKEFPNYVLIYYVLARCYEARKDWDKAYACFVRNAGLQPKNPYALRLCGAYHLQHGKLDEAEAALKRTLKLDPISYPDVYVNLAKVHSAKQDPAKMKETFEKGVSATWNPGLVLLLAQILHIDGQDQERTNMLRKALEMYPDNADLKAALAGPLPKAQ
jgi:tetratricopeptide (TPR) repeat protein